MRSPEGFIEEHGPQSGGRLFSFYALVFFWYVLASTVAGILGFEPLYMQVAPFYASASAASSVPGAATAALLVALLLYAILRRVAGAPVTRRVWLGSLAAFLLLLTMAQIGAALARQAATVGDFWRDFRWDMLLLGVVTIATLLASRLLRRAAWWDEELPNKSAWRVAIALVLFSFALSGSIAMLRDGASGIATAYSRVQYEYVDDIGKGVTLLSFLRSYNELHPLLSMHAKVHPPGPVVMLWIMSSLLLSRDALVLSLGTMAAGSLAVLPLFAWVRDMLGQRVALTCAAFYTLMPSIVLFTATSADILFMPFVFLTLLCFWRAIHRGSAVNAIAAGVLYALLSLMSFSLLTLGAFFAIVGLWRLMDPDKRVAVIKTAIVMLASFLLFHAAFKLLTGFDIVECFRLSHGQFVEDQRNLDIVQPRYPSWTFKFLNPLCWFFFAGIPTSILFLWRQLKPGAQHRPLARVFLLTFLVVAPLYLARGEGERSAMYVLPFVLVPAAQLLDELGMKARSLQPMAMTFVFLLLQSWLIESYLYTYW